MAVYKNHGKWMYDFWKKKVRHTQGGFETMEEARIAEAEARKNLAKTNLGFGRLCGSRLKDLKQRRTDKYFKENKALIKNLIRRWGKLKKITRKDVEDYLHEVALESHYVANKQLRFIKALFNHGLDMDIYPDNPADRIKYFPISRTKKYVPPEADISKVLAVVNDEQRNYLNVVIHTLGRINEVNQLRWEDVHEKYLILKTRKSKNSDLVERAIPINETLKEVLNKIPKDNEYVFHYKGNKIVYRDKFLKNACKKAEVREFGFHNLRHYGASKLAASLVPLPDIQLILGHTSLTTTVIYIQSICPQLIGALRNLESQ